MKGVFQRKLNSLDDVMRFAERFSKENRLPRMYLPHFQLVLEELFINSVKYNPDNENPIQIEMNRDDFIVRIEYTDFQVPRFDITQAPDYRIKENLKRRRPGGMGIYLVKKTMDDITYRYKDGNSCITLIKYLEKKNVQH